MRTTRINLRANERDIAPLLRKNRAKGFASTGSSLHHEAMAEIINLKRARKAKARAAAEAEAAANRATHGRSKAERKLTQAEQRAAKRKLDGHKRNDHGDDDRDF
jgi:hypothetical protein